MLELILDVKMKKIERILISAVVHSTEDPNKVGEAISLLFPFEFKIDVYEAKGYYGNPIKYLEVKISKKQEIKEFWNYFIKLLDEKDKNYLLDTLEHRIDNQNILHIRIDKQKAYLGSIRIVEGGDAIVLKIKIVTYPARKEKVVKAVKELIINGY